MLGDWFFEGDLGFIIAAMKADRIDEDFGARGYRSPTHVNEALGYKTEGIFSRLYFRYLRLLNQFSERFLCLRQT
jgi:hypothetical protein